MSDLSGFDPPDDELIAMNQPHRFTGTTGRSARNFNFLNIEYHPGWQEKYGAVPEPGYGRFSAYPNPEAGYQANLELIRRYQQNLVRPQPGGHTLASFVYNFSPPFQNPTQQLVSQYANALGVSPNTPLSSIPAEALFDPMAARESSTRRIRQADVRGASMPKRTIDISEFDPPEKQELEKTQPPIVAGKQPMSGPSIETVRAAEDLIAKQKKLGLPIPPWLYNTMAHAAIGTTQPLAKLTGVKGLGPGFEPTKESLEQQLEKFGEASDLAYQMQGGQSVLPKVGGEIAGFSHVPLKTFEAVPGVAAGLTKAIPGAERALRSSRLLRWPAAAAVGYGTTGLAMGELPHPLKKMQEGHPILGAIDAAMVPVMGAQFSKAFKALPRTSSAAVAADAEIQSLADAEFGAVRAAQKEEAAADVAMPATKPSLTFDPGFSPQREPTKLWYPLGKGTEAAVPGTPTIMSNHPWVGKVSPEELARGVEPPVGELPGLNPIEKLKRDVQKKKALKKIKNKVSMGLGGTDPRTMQVLDIIRNMA